jgi:hypothetical protein
LFKGNPVSNLDPLLQSKDLKIDLLTLVNRPAFDVQYDSRLDVLKLVFPEHEYAVYPVDECLSILYQPDDLEVVGFMLQDFEAIFLKAYPDVLSVWSSSQERVLTFIMHIFDKIGVQLVRNPRRWQP